MADRFATNLKDSDQLVEYLVHEYEVSEVRAKEIVRSPKHKEVIQYGMEIASFVNYIGDQIADAEGLEPKEEPDDEEIAYDNDET